MRETKKFHETKQKYVSFTMVIKRSPGGESAGGGRSTFEIHLCSSGVIFDCIWRSTSIHVMSKFSASVNSDLGNGSFWLEIRDAEHVERCS